jgi:ADP-ribosylglycohydrolase
MGAILGAACGLDVIPPHWIETIENGGLLLQLADELCEISTF